MVAFAKEADKVAERVSRKFKFSFNVTSTTGPLHRRSRSTTTGNNIYHNQVL